MSSQDHGAIVLNTKIKLWVGGSLSVDKIITPDPIYTQENNLIKAITFDFWDTIVYDDSDEPKRAARGMLNKRTARISLLQKEIQQYHPRMSDQSIIEAFQHTEDWCNRCWKQEHYNPSVAQRLMAAYNFLKLEQTQGFEDVVSAFERMEIDIPPDLAPGLRETLEVLSQNYTLGIISDAVITPGWGLRQIMENAQIADYFKVFIFSDQIGASKPSPVVFQAAQQALGLPFSQIAHVGDRESNDVEGPRALGIKTIFYTGVIDRGSTHTRADAICPHHHQLAEIIAKL